MGCGPDKIPGATGVDHHAFPGVDVVWNLEQTPYPFADSSADRIYFRHSLEHLDNAQGALQESARILKRGGRLTVITPHFSSLNAYSDVTHRHAFALNSFRALALAGQNREDARVIYRSGLVESASGRERALFRFVEGRFTFWKLHDRFGFVPHRWLGVEWIANRFPVLYERFLAFLCPAMELTVTLEAVKETAAR